MHSNIHIPQYYYQPFTHLYKSGIHQVGCRFCRQDHKLKYNYLNQFYKFHIFDYCSLNKYLYEGQHILHWDKQQLEDFNKQVCQVLQYQEFLLAYKYSHYFDFLFLPHNVTILYQINSVYRAKCSLFLQNYYFHILNIQIP